MKAVFLRVALIAFAFLAATPARADELLVSAAMSLKEAFIQIGTEFEQKNPGNKINFNFGASGELSQQIARGAPADIFASASFKEINSLQKQHLLIGNSVQSFARNRLVVIVPRGGRRIKSLPELESLERITIGNPETVPAGKYAAQALASGNIYARLLAQHKLILAESVRQALAYVEGANVDAGIVYSTDARVAKQVVVSLVVPDRLTEPIVYPIALVNDSKHVELGRRFIEFVASARAQSILQNKGFLSAVAK